MRAILGADSDVDLGFCLTSRPQGAAIGSGFSDRLREMRVRQGLSFRRLGRLVHYSHGYLWDLETGSKRPTEAVASALDAVLGADGELSALASKSAAPQDLERNSLGQSFARRPPTELVAATSFKVMTPEPAASCSAITLTVTAGEIGIVRVVVEIRSGYITGDGSVAGFDGKE
ncbi:helix-turn-helix domain-containing protein [Plantactinospora solaniradicis]|uniref:Helix-turn-helix domain-containing protein n=1 Tax=Plantactinospora solaniradicis TaxID=1723736 RepID=A0ABW1KFS0_9ACTN